MTWKCITKYLSIIVIGISSCSCDSNFINKVEVKQITSENLNISNYLGIDKSDQRKYKGSESIVVIFDTGISISESVPKERVLLFKDFVNKLEIPYDDNGHGTIVANIIGADGKLIGLAPESQFIILKVLDKFGETDINTLKTALEFILDNIDKYHINVINISLGINKNTNTYYEELDQLLRDIDERGIVITTSAGNRGRESNQVLYPGSSEYVITVGSVKNNGTYNINDDKKASFSVHDSAIHKPDIYTLGVDITSFDNNYNIVTSSGSSFSTAIVTGVLASLSEKYKISNRKSALDILRSKQQVNDEIIWLFAICCGMLENRALFIAF